MMVEFEPLKWNVALWEDEEIKRNRSQDGACDVIRRDVRACFPFNARPGNCGLFLSTSTRWSTDLCIFIFIFFWFPFGRLTFTFKNDFFSTRMMKFHFNNKYFKHLFRQTPAPGSVEINSSTSLFLDLCFLLLTKNLKK